MSLKEELRENVKKHHEEENKRSFSKYEKWLESILGKIETYIKKLIFKII